MNGTRLTEKARWELNAMRIEHRLTFDEIARLAKVSSETARKGIKLGGRLRDFHVHALQELLKKYTSGKLKFENGKAVENMTL